MIRKAFLYSGLVVALVALVGALPTTPATAIRAAAPQQLVTAGTLPTTAGNDIYDFQLAEMINRFIPAASAHSTLLVFTQCYGGNFLDDFAARPNTAVLAANMPGKPSYYRGYHDDAARALFPASGRTSNNVHHAGIAGSSRREMPVQGGSPVSLAPTGENGIESRHVLVYAGFPNALDRADCRNIERNFAGQTATTVTTVGCAGTSGQDYPATMDGLRSALQAIGAQMGPDEQFVLFVTDHGNIDTVDNAPTCDGTGSCVTQPLAPTAENYQDMLNDTENEPALSLLSPNIVTGPTTVVYGPDSFFDVFFDIPIDLNGDGDMTDPGEGWLAHVPLTEEQVTPAGAPVTAQNPLGLDLSWVGLESGAITRPSEPYATLAPASEDDTSITDFQLRQMLDEFIPTANVHSTLLIFTQCFGGNMLDDFAGRENTTTLSATSPGEVAWYGGYHDDAAEALRPETGRTSDDVHNAGVAGQDPEETPMQQGGPVSLEPIDPTNPSAEIQSRHVLVYAGQPNAQDEADCATIEGNFAGQSATTVTTVGCDGSSGQDYPATFDGLQAALQAIGAQMNPHEQFILFVTDHGDLDVPDEAPACDDGTCASIPLALGSQAYGDMLNDAHNHPAVDLFFPGPTAPAPVSVVVGAQSFFDVFFDIAIDLNGDGDMADEGEGWLAHVLLDEALIDPMGEVVMVTATDATFDLGRISLQTGEIAKRYRGTLFLPIIQRAAP